MLNVNKRKRKRDLGVSERKELQLARSIGVDIGTGFIICAEKENEEITYRKIRDAFYKVDTSKFLEGAGKEFGENMLKSSGAHYIKMDEDLYVLGDDAFKFANMFHQECLRPMSRGVLNPKETVSSTMMMELVKYLITLMKPVWQKTRLLFTLQTKASTWENTVGLIKDSCMRNPLELRF